MLGGWDRFIMLWELPLLPLYTRRLLFMIQSIKIQVMMIKDCNTLNLSAEGKPTLPILLMGLITNLVLIICVTIWFINSPIKFKRGIIWPLLMRLTLFLLMKPELL